MKTLVGLIFFASVSLLVSDVAFSSDRHQVERFEDAAPDIHSFHAFLTAVSAKLDSDDEVEWEEGIQSTIWAIEDLLKKDDQQKFEFYERMSDRYQDLFTIEAARERREYFEKLADYRWSDGKKDPPRFDHSASEVILLKRVNVLRDLVSKFDKDLRKPRALWVLASSMARLEQEHSLHYFSQLFKKYTKSEYVSFAKVSVGDYYFSKSDFTKAEEAYKEAIAYKVPIVKNFAIYKLGWTNYMQSLDEKDKAKREKLVQKTLAALKLVVLYEKEQEHKGRFDLQEEALQDFTWLTAEMGARKEAFEFYAKIENTEAPWLYTKFTAEKNMRTEDYNMALSLYHQMIERNDEALELPQMYAHTIYASSQLMKPELALRYLEKLDFVVSHEDSDWLDEVSSSRRIRDRGQAVYFRVARTIGDRLLGRAQDETNNVLKKNYANQAIRYYQYFAEHFPTKKVDQDLRYNMASAYFIGEDFRQSAQAFADITSDASFDSERRLGSAYFRIASLQNVDAKAGDVKLPEFGKATEKIRMSDTKYRLISAIDRFVKMAPPGEESTQFQLMAAMQFYNYGHYEEALKRLASLGQTHIVSEQGQQAIQLVLAHLMERKQWTDLYQVSKQFLGADQVAGSPLVSTLKEHYDYASYMVKSKS